MKRYSSFAEYVLERPKGGASLPVPLVKRAGQNFSLSIPIVTIIGVQVSYPYVFMLMIYMLLRGVYISISEHRCRRCVDGGWCDEPIRDRRVVPRFLCISYNAPRTFVFVHPHRHHRRSSGKLSMLLLYWYAVAQCLHSYLGKMVSVLGGVIDQ